MGAIELIKSDLFRYAGTTSSKAFIKTYVKEAGFRFSVAFRLVNAGGGSVKSVCNNPMEIEKSPADSDTSKNKNWLWTIYRSWWASGYKSNCCDRK